MADNTTIQSPTTPGDIISTEDLGGVKIPRTKIALGAHGVDGGDITNANPLPVSGIGTFTVQDTAAETSLSAIQTQLSGSIITNPADTVATSGSISAVDAGTSSTTNSLGQNIITGTPTASSSVTINVSGVNTIRIVLSAHSGNFYNGTVVFEKSADNGSTYFQCAVTNSEIFGTSTTATFTGVSSVQEFRVSAGGLTNFRVRSNARTAGQLDVRLQPGYGVTDVSVPSTLSVYGNVASGVTDSGSPVKIGGVYNTSQPTVTNGQRVDCQMDSHGNLYTNLATQLDKVNDSIRVNICFNGLVDSSGNLLTISNYQGSPSASGVNVLIAAQGVGKKIYVIGYTFQGTGTVSANLQDTTPTVLTPAWNLGATAPAVAGIREAAPAGQYLFATGANQGLNLNLSTNVAVNVSLRYIVL